MAKYGYLYAPFSGDETYGDKYAKTYQFYIYWEVLSQSAKKGTTKLYLSWGLNKIASNSASVNTTGSAKLTAIYDETTLKENGSVSFDLRNYSVGKHKSVFNKTITVEHDATGRCFVDVYGYIDTDISLGTSEITGSIELPVIPRDSFVTATDALIGSKSLVYVGHSYDSYSHSLAISFGDIKGWLDKNGNIVDTEVIFSETSVSFPVPTSFYDQIPNSISGTVTLTLTTYEGATQIGETATSTFTVSVDPVANAPDFSAPYKEVDSTAYTLSGYGSAIVKNLSDIAITVTATAKNGASIAKCVVEGVEVENGGTVTFVDTTTNYFVVAVTDSRGITSEGIVGMDGVDYFRPSISFSGKRQSQTSNDVDVSVIGKYFNGLFGSNSLASKNNATVYWRSCPKNGEWSEYTTLATFYATDPGNDFSFSATLGGIDYRYTYEIEIMVQDASGTSNSAVIVIPKGIPLFDWSDTNMRFHVPLAFDDEAKEQTRENLGITETEAINPADILAWKEIGSWEYGGSIECDFTQYTEIKFVCDYYNDGFYGWGGGEMTIPVIALRDDVDYMYFGNHNFQDSWFSLKLTMSSAKTYGVYVNGSSYSGYKIYCYGR